MAEEGRRKFKRVLLKLSGEALREPGSQENISPPIVESIASQIKAAHQSGLEIALVVGGGNFWRGVSASNRGMERATGDYMGMLATVINSLALQAVLETSVCRTRVQSAITMDHVAEPFIRRRACGIWSRAAWYLRRRHRESVLFHRHGGGPARERNRRRRHPQGHQGGWHL